MFHFAARTACGQQHNQNEDRIFCVNAVPLGAEEPSTEVVYASSYEGDTALACVFDGVSLSNQGDVAAGIAALSLLKMSESEMPLSKRLDTCAREAYENQAARGDDRRGLAAAAGLELRVTTPAAPVDSAATATAPAAATATPSTATATPSTATATPFHVGDCRAFRFSNNHLVKLTCDHSLAEEYRRQYGPDADVPPKIAHVITRCIGDEDSSFEMGQALPCLSGDIYMCCSDGAWDHISEAEFAAILTLCDPRDPESLSLATDRIVGLAQDHNSPDDISVVLISWIDPNAETPARNGASSKTSTAAGADPNATAILEPIEG